MAAHDLAHLDPVRRPACGRLEQREGLAKILRTDRRRRNHAERLRVVTPEIVEPMDRTAGDAERLSRSDGDGPPVDGPGQDSREAVDRLLVMIVAVGRSRQALAG